MAVSQVDALKNPVRGVNVEELDGCPAAAECSGDANQAGEEKAV
jgi:hypothetical protein